MTSTARLLPNEVTCDPCCLADELTPPWQIGQRAGGMVALAKTASLFVPRTSSLGRTGYCAQGNRLLDCQDHLRFRAKGAM
jgi:hypothetical protein